MKKRFVIRIFWVMGVNPQRRDQITIQNNPEKVKKWFGWKSLLQKEEMVWRVKLKSRQKQAELESSKIQIQLFWICDLNHFLKRHWICNLKFFFQNIFEFEVSFWWTNVHCWWFKSNFMIQITFLQSLISWLESCFFLTHSDLWFEPFFSWICVHSWVQDSHKIECRCFFLGYGKVWRSVKKRICASDKRHIFLIQHFVVSENESNHKSKYFGMKWFEP